MGDEISKTHFEAEDYARYDAVLREELSLIDQWSRTDAFARLPSMFGAELEAWLLDSAGNPVAENEQFLETLADEEVVPELAKFNFELNVTPQLIAGDGLAKMRSELGSTWQRCGELASQINRRITTIGILPTVTPEQLCLQNMTSRARFAALNRQMHKMRHGRPIKMRIDGIDRVEVDHYDVMLESAATSLQVHLTTPIERATRMVNAAIAASAFTVAVAANAPLLFGKRVWHDSRIPVFEQAVDTGHSLGRVGFDEGWASDPVTRLFHDKVDHHPVLLPVMQTAARYRVPHLRLHNGTIWTWNRPLIGFEANGQPHLRIEHRVMSAGPTLDDVFANIAFATGLIHGLSELDQPIESQVAFSDVRNSFYAGARYGLDATVQWVNGPVRMAELLVAELVPLAFHALDRLGVEAKSVHYYRSIIEARVRTNQTGAAWQLKSFATHNGDCGAVVKDYLTQVATLRPVHEW